MAITITKLKMWKNPGYTKGCVEVPPAGSKKLPAPDYTSITNLRPRKNGTISAIELPLSFCQVFEMSYLYMEFQDNSNNQCKVFGWIDSIEQTASGDEAVLIRWDVDWWRTYSGSITWGTGKITRCTDSSLRRPPTIQPRYNVFSKYAEITDTFNIIWGIVVFSDTNNNGDTFVRTGIFPAGQRVFGHTPENVLTAPSIKDCYNGYLDERVGIDPSSIYGIWFSPICPCDSVTIASDSGGSYYNMSGATITNSKAKSGYCMPIIDYDKIRSHTVFVSGTDTALTEDDLRTFGVVDFEGSLVGTFPWHSGIRSDDPAKETAGYINARIEVSPSGCYLVLRQTLTKFFPYAENYLTGAGGGMIKVPLPSAPTNSNGTSSYVYSGQRQADIETAKVQQDQRFVNNLLGVGGSAISGGVGGAMAGKGTGAVIGTAVGTGVALGSAFVSNWAEDEFRDRLQGINDRAHANQTSQLIIPGTGNLWVNICPHPYIVQIDADSVTKTQYANMISANGYETEHFGSPATLITSGGAIQVTDLNITGSVPPQAKTSIKSMLEKGIRIIENNPSGVVP